MNYRHIIYNFMLFVAAPFVEIHYRNAVRDNFDRFLQN